MYMNNYNERIKYLEDIARVEINFVYFGINVRLCYMSFEGKGLDI